MLLKKKNQLYVQTFAHAVTKDTQQTASKASPGAWLQMKNLKWRERRSGPRPDCVLRFV